MGKTYVYLLERMRDSIDWKKGMLIWAHQPCKGWKIIRKQEV